ncbi:cell division control protein 48 [Mycena alexandri]|uniref:Cell division control protein 48 n=1 Tax=Mycena alexandri TaxID=1745969 RepID=A0AAD6XC95_9AGAR|nr:cell division control protein 48 [Mycena alexandri]
MKMMTGEFFLASSNTFRRLLSLSPAILLVISGPLMRKKKATVSLAPARAMRVLPVPEGPNIRIP